MRVLNNNEFVDKAPAAIFNSLLDRGVYHCSTRTMYRLLSAHGAVAERRKVARARSFAALFDSFAPKVTEDAEAMKDLMEISNDNASFASLGLVLGIAF